MACASLKRQFPTYRYILPITNTLVVKILAIRDTPPGSYRIAQYGDPRYRFHPLRCGRETVIFEGHIRTHRVLRLEEFTITCLSTRGRAWRFCVNVSAWCHGVSRVCHGVSQACHGCVTDVSPRVTGVSRCVTGPARATPSSMSVSPGLRGISVRLP